VLAQQDHAPHHKHKHKHKHTHQQNPMQTHTQHTTRPTHHPRPIDAPNENTQTQTQTHTHTRTHLYGPHTSYHPVMRDQPVHTLLDLTRLDWLRSSFFVRDRTQHTGAPVTALSLFPFLQLLNSSTPQLLNSSPTIESNRRRTPRQDKRLVSKPASERRRRRTHKRRKNGSQGLRSKAKHSTARRSHATQRNAAQTVAVDTEGGAGTRANVWWMAADGSEARADAVWEVFVCVFGCWWVLEKASKS
jgi:hypothetical protein